MKCACIIVLLLAATSVLASGVECLVISEQSSYIVGEAPRLRIAIVNTGDTEVMLPGSLDGSERRSRYPHAFFTFEGPVGTIEPEFAAACGNTNDLRRQDFVRLAPGESFDPHAPVDNGGFWRSQLLNGFVLDRPGDYEFTFHYSTEAPDLDAWRGTPVCPNCPLDEDVVALTGRTPHVSIRCSTRVSVSPW